MKTLARLILVALCGLVLPAGCATTGGTQQVHQVSSVQASDATIHIKELACPYCVYNVERSQQEWLDP